MNEKVKELSIILGKIVDSMIYCSPEFWEKKLYLLAEKYYSDIEEVIKE